MIFGGAFLFARKKIHALFCCLCYCLRCVRKLGRMSYFLFYFRPICAYLLFPPYRRVKFAHKGPKWNEKVNRDWRYISSNWVFCHFLSESHSKQKKATENELMHTIRCESRAIRPFWVHFWQKLSKRPLFTWESIQLDTRRKDQILLTTSGTASSLRSGVDVCLLKRQVPFLKFNNEIKVRKWQITTWKWEKIYRTLWELGSDWFVCFGNYKQAEDAVMGYWMCTIIAYIFHRSGCDWAVTL